MSNENEFMDDEFADGFEPMDDFGQPTDAADENGDLAEAAAEAADDFASEDALLPVANTEFSTKMETPIEYRKPTWDIYTLLLFLALAFIGLAGTAMFFESAPPDYPSGTAPFKGVPR